MKIANEIRAKPYPDAEPFILDDFDDSDAIVLNSMDLNHSIEFDPGENLYTVMHISEPVAYFSGWRRAFKDAISDLFRRELMENFESAINGIDWKQNEREKGVTPK